MATGAVAAARGSLRFAGRAAWPALDAGLRLVESQAPGLSGDELLERVIARARASDEAGCPLPVAVTTGLGLRVEVFAGDVRDALCHAVLCNGRDAVAEAPSPHTAPKPPERCAGEGKGGGLVFDEWLSSDSELAAEKAACFLHYLNAATSASFDATRPISFQLRSQAPLPDTTTTQWPSVRVHIGEFTEREEDTTFMNFANHVFLYGKLTSSLKGVSVEEFLQVEYPELCAGLLYFGCLRDEESVVADGVRKSSFHSGYMKSFKCAGAVTDLRPFRVLSLDAKNYDPETSEDKEVTYGHQFHAANVMRDVGKASVAFYGCEAVSTGKWGCGTFKGNVYLKFLEQVLSAAKAGTKELSFTSYRVQEEANRCTELRDALMVSHVTPAAQEDFLKRLPGHLGEGKDDAMFFKVALEWLLNRAPKRQLQQE